MALPWCVFAFLLHLPSAFAGSGGFGAPEGLLAPCEAKDELNSEVSEKAGRDGVAQGCRDMVSKQIKICFPPFKSGSNLDVLKDKVHGIGMLKTANAQRELYLWGQGQLNSHGLNCIAGIREIKNTCGEMINDLRQALSDNTRASRIAQAEIDAMEPDDPNRRARIEQHKQYHQISMELQSQVTQTHSLSVAAERAINVGVHCYFNQADLYGQAAKQVEQTIALTRATDDAELAIAEPEDLKSSEDGYQQTVKSQFSEVVMDKSLLGAAQISERAIPKASNAAKAIGKSVPGLGLAVNAATGDPVGVAFSGAEIGAYLMGASTTTTSLIAGAGIAIPIALYPKPAGACSDLPQDPVYAYRSDCPIAVIPNVVANEVAINTLSQP